MRLSVVLAVFFTLVSVVLGGGYFTLPYAASWVAENVLAENGFPDARVSIDGIGLTQIRMSEIDLGPGKGARISTATIDFSMGRLAEGIIDGVTLERPNVSVSISAAGVNLGPFSAEADPSAGPPAFRVIGPVTVSDGRFSVETPAGTVAAGVDGVVLLTDGLGTRASASFALDHKEARVAGRLTGTFDDDNNVQLNVEIADAASDATLAFSKLSGAINLDGTFPNALGGRASLTIRDTAFQDLPIGNVDFAGTLKERALYTELLIAGDGTGLTMQLEVENTDVFDPSSTVHVIGDIATDGLTGDFALPGDMNIIGALGFDLRGPQESFRDLPMLASGQSSAMKGGVSGQVRADLLGVFLPAKDFDATVDGAADIRLDGRGVQLKPSDHLDVDIGVLVAGRGRSIQARLQAIDDLPFLLWGVQPEKALELGMRFTSDIEGVGILAGEAGGAIWQTGEGTIFENMVVRLRPWQMRIDEMDVVVESFRAALSGPEDDMTIDVQGNARFSGALSDRVKITGGSVAFASDVGFADSGVSLRPEGCIDIRADAYDLDGYTLRTGPLALCPGDDRAPLLFVAMAGDALKRLDFEGSLSGAEYTLEGIDEVSVAGKLPRFLGAASFDVGRQTWWAKTDISGGDVQLEELGVGLGGFKGDLTFEGRERLLGARLKLKSSTLADKNRPRRFTPVSVTGEGKVSADDVMFSGSLRASGNAAAAIDFRHQIREQRGQVSFELPEWRLDDIGGDIDTVIPMLKGVLVAPTGTLSGDGRIAWSSDRLSSSGKISIDNVGFSGQSYDIKGIDGVFEFSDLIDPKTAGEQAVTVGMIDAGLPFPGGRILFSMPGDRTIVVREAIWPFAGGSIGFRDLVVPLDRSLGKMEAQIEVLNAKDLVTLSDVEDLDITGTLSGEIPIRLTDAGAVLDDAYLRAVGGGVIRYTAAEAMATLKQSGGNAEILAQALEDFQYTDLEISLNGPLDGEVLAKAQVKGANPELYDGKKIELNVNLQGTLRDFLRSASVVQDIPGVLRERTKRPAGTQ